MYPDKSIHVNSYHLHFICQDTLPQGSQFRYTKIMIFGCIAGLLLVDSKYGGRRCQLLVVGSWVHDPWDFAQRTSLGWQPFRPFGPFGPFGQCFLNRHGRQTRNNFFSIYRLSLCIHCIDDWCMNFWFCQNKLVMLPFTIKFCHAKDQTSFDPNLYSLAWTEPKARMPQATAMMGPPLVVAGLVRLPSRQKGSFDSYLDSCTVLVNACNFLEFLVALCTTLYINSCQLCCVMLTTNSIFLEDGTG